MSTGYIRMLMVTESEERVLEEALEMYIRLHLGQVSEIGTHLRLLSPRRPHLQIDEIVAVLNNLEQSLFNGSKPWSLEDGETSTHALRAFAILAKLTDDRSALHWAWRRYRERRSLGEE